MNVIKKMALKLIQLLKTAMLTHGRAERCVGRQLAETDSRSERVPWKYVCDCYMMLSNEKHISNISRLTGKQRDDVLRHNYRAGCDYSHDADCEKCNGTGDIR